MLALSFTAFAPALGAGFVSDDTLAITGNEHVTGPMRPGAIFTTFSWWGRARADAPGYRPLATLAFAVDHAIAGLDPAYFHAVNLIMHGLVAWLVFELAVRLDLGRRAALLAATAFCLLPIHSEAVVWAVGRAELMAAAGYAGALCLLLDYRRGGRPITLASAALLFVAALFSKENAVTLLAAPVLLALLVPGSPAVRKRDVFSACALVAGLALYLVARASAGPLLGSAAGDRLDNPLSVLPTAARWLGAAAVLGRYLVLTVWPRLSVDYSYNALAIDEGFRGDVYVAVAVIASVALAWYGARAGRRTPAVPVGLLLAAASYSIVSNFVVVIGTAMAERLFYLPTVGLALAAVPALERAARASSGRGVFALGAVALLWGGIDLARASEWRSPIALFESAVERHPRSARAQMELGGAYGREGRTEEAVVAFRRALEVMPAYAAAWYNLGNLYARRARYDEAVEAYERALEHAPQLGSAWFNLALTHRMRNRNDEAADTLRRAAEIAPSDPAISMALGDTYLAMGRWLDAIERYTRTLELDPELWAARINRGVARQRTAGCDAALPDYLEVLSAQPAEPTALANASSCLESSGRRAEAEELRRRSRVANRQGDR